MKKFVNRPLNLWIKMEGQGRIFRKLSMDQPLEEQDICLRLLVNVN